jgi:hypothetical protein
MVIQYENIPETIVDEIIADIQGRSGMDGMWDSIDEEVQKEIKEEWVSIIRHWISKT